MTATDTAEMLPRATSASRAAEAPLRPALPVLLVVAASVAGLTSAQGGYFPTSWGLIATLLLWTTALWLVVAGRTDAGRVDLLVLGLLGAVAIWTGLSITWSLVPAQSVLELERTIVPLAGVAAVLLLARREHVPRLHGVLLAAIASVCTYSLATRLFPERLGTYDSIATYRLSEPLGYWNTLGVFAAMGALLGLGVVSDSRARWARASAAAAVVVLTVTLYFTYSRGAWIALAAALFVLLAVTPRRLHTIAALAVVAVPAGVAVLLASRSYALTHENVRLAQISADGHRLAPVLLLLALAAAALVLVLDFAQRRLRVPRRARMALGGVLLAAAVAVVVAAVGREGGPVALARNGWSAFSDPPAAATGNLNARLFSFSGNGRVDLWHAARDEYIAHRLTGGGAGTFERTWQSRSDTAFKVRDAHSLYLETLAELGPVGLALLVALLLVPVAVGLLVRRHALLPAALAAYVAFLIHAGVDWDWEFSGVVLTALLVGSLGVIALRKRRLRTIGGTARVVACVPVLLASLGMMLAFLGNGALDRAQDDVAAKSYAAAVDEANRARRLMPWSPWPLIARGDAQLAVGDATSAAGSFRHAISIDSGEWRAWLGLAFASEGRTRASALAEARRLYPRSAEITSAVARLQDATNG